MDQLQKDYQQIQNRQANHRRHHRFIYTEQALKVICIRKFWYLQWQFDL